MKNFLMLIIVAVSVVACDGTSSYDGYYYDDHLYDGYDCYDYYCDSGYYYDDGYYYDGYLYEKLGATPKNLSKVKAIAEVKDIESRAQYLNAELGLSMERSREVSRLTTHWKKASKKGMTAAEENTYATELFGFSISDAKKAATEGSQGIDGLINTAASVNGITPEHASKLMTKVFGL